MKTQKVILSILCMVILWGCGSLNAAGKKEFSNTQYASAMIRIQAHSSFVQMDDDASLYAIFRPVILQAVSNVYSGVDTKDEEMGENLAMVEFLGYQEGPGLEGVVQVSLDVSLDFFNEDLPKAAEEIKKEILDRLKNNLDRAYSEYQKSCSQKEGLYAQQVAQAEAKMNELHKALFEISRGKKMSQEFLEDQITGLSKELDEAEFHHGVGENRCRLLDEQLGEAQGRRHEKQINDPILKEFEEKLGLLEQRLQQARKLFEAGKVSAAEIQEIEQRLIEARIELAERREMAEQSPEAQRIRELKEQMAHLSLEQSELAMRHQFLQSQLEYVRHMLDRSTEYETLRIKAEVQRDAFRDSIEQLEELRRENRLLTPPMVTVISQ